MAEEAVAESRAFMRAFDEAGNVGDDEFLGVGQADDAELRVQGGEGVVGDFRPGGGDDGEEGGLAGIGQADKPDIGDEFQPQPDPAFLTRPAFVGAAGGAVGGGFEMGVAEAAIAAFEQYDAFAGGVEVGQHGFLIVVEDLGADGHFDHHVVRAGAGHIGARAVAAFAGAEMLGVAEVDQGVEVGHRLKDDVPAAPAHAAIGATVFDEAFTPEGDDAVAAVAGAEIDFGLVEELHG